MLLRFIVPAIAGILLTATLTACEKEGPAERAGKQVDKAIEQAGQKIEEAGDKAREATER